MAKIGLTDKPKLTTEKISELVMRKMPKLGFGLMRLPKKGAEHGEAAGHSVDDEIDIEETCRMIDAYMDAGMNYFDTAYTYGQSEAAAKAALVSRYPRDSFYLATKLPAWSLKTPDDRDRIFAEQLKRTGAGYFDFYLLHSLEDGPNYDAYEKYDCFRWAIEKKAEGLIRHFGFSYHGSPELLEQVLDAHPEVEFVQIQINYADLENPVVRSRALYEVLRRRGMPIIVMEPVKGGMLANLPPDQEAVLKAVRPDASCASWAMRFVGSLPGVMTILSGMTTEDQVRDNIKTFVDFRELNDREKAAIEQVRKLMLDKPLIGCTACRYCCEGCPAEISIPDVFRAVNTYRLYGEKSRPQFFYNSLIERSGRASDCIACGQCEGICPQHLPIISLMEEASELLDKQ